MAESYKKIFPGNIINHQQGYALPNDDFATNGRAVGDPRDRKHGCWVIAPGWQAVRKVGIAHIEAAATEWDVVLPSPDLRSDDKPRADVVGLFIPTGAAVVRAGIRVPSGMYQPGYFSSGGNKAADEVESFITGTTGNFLCLSSAPITVAAVGSIGATAIQTTSDEDSASDPAALKIDANGKMPVGFELVQTAFGSPQVTTADMTLKLRSLLQAGTGAGSAMSSTLTGGVNVVCEVVYLIREAVAGLSDVHVAGAKYTGYGG